MKDHDQYIKNAIKVTKTRWLCDSNKLFIRTTVNKHIHDNSFRSKKDARAWIESIIEDDEDRKYGCFAEGESPNRKKKPGKFKITVIVELAE